MIFRNETVSNDECRPGIVFQHCSGVHYILARVGRKKVALINLKDGNRWAPAVIVEGYPLSKDEWFRVTNNKPSEFVLAGPARRVISIED